MAERSATKSTSQEETSSRINSGTRSSKRGRQQNTAPKRSASNQIVPQKRAISKNRGAFSNKLQEDARIRENIERDNICLLERIAKIMNPPGGALVSSAYNLRRPPKSDREEIKLKQQKREKERLAIENENLAILEKLATIMAPQPGGPSWNDYKKSKWSGKPAQDKLPLITQEPRSVMSRKPVPKEQKAMDFAQIEAENITILEKLATIMTPKPGGATWVNYDLASLSMPKYVTKMPKISPSKGTFSQGRGRPRDMKLKEVPVKRNSIEVANLAMLERLAKIMAPPPGGPSWKDYEKKRYGPNQRSTEFPSISKAKGGMKQNKQRYSTKDQNESWRDINQKLPAVSSNTKTMIDDKPPMIYVKRHGKTLREEELDQQRAAIRKGNMKMVEKLLHQIQRPSTVDCWNDKKLASLNRDGRESELRRIAEDNRAFAKRLQMIANQPGRYYYDHISQKMLSL